MYLAMTVLNLPGALCEVSARPYFSCFQFGVLRAKQAREIAPDLLDRLGNRVLCSQAQNETKMVLLRTPLEQMKLTILTDRVQMFFETCANRSGEQGFGSPGAKTDVVMKLICGAQ